MDAGKIHRSSLGSVSTLVCDSLNVYVYVYIQLYICIKFVYTCKTLSFPAHIYVCALSVMVQVSRDIDKTAFYTIENSLGSPRSQFLVEVFPQHGEHQSLHTVSNDSCLQTTAKQAHVTVFLHYSLDSVSIANFF